MSITLPPLASIGIGLSARLDSDISRSEGVRIEQLNGSTPVVSASSQDYHHYEDEGFREPSHPADFRLGDAPVQRVAPALAQAVQGVQQAVAGVDWANVAKRPDSIGHNYVTLSLTFTQRPEGLDHLHPFATQDGWLVSVQSPLDNLFASPQLEQVVDAARLVIRAARTEASQSAKLTA